MKKYIVLLILLALIGCKQKGPVDLELTRLSFDDYPESQDIKKQIIIARTPEGIIVTADDLYEWLDIFYSGRRGEFFADKEKLEKVINELIEHKIGVYIAKQRGYDKEPDFFESLQKLRKYYEYRAEQNLVKKLITIEVDKRIDTSETALRKFYRENQDDIDRFFLYTLTTQCFSNSPQEEIIRAKNKIEEAYQLLKKGEDFINISRMYGEGNMQFVQSGGLVGWIKKGDRTRVFDRNLDKLKPGEFTEPFLTPQGYVIIFVEKIERYRERYNYIKNLYYDRMVSRLNRPVKNEIVTKFKREIYLKDLELYIKGRMGALEKSLEDQRQREEDTIDIDED